MTDALTKINTPDTGIELKHPTITASQRPIACFEQLVVSLFAELGEDNLY